MENRYNPDVLNCIANLSNDEVFTPPSLANQLLDLLPSGLFESPETKFLDPFTKSGVFLREIVKRLDKGLESVIPDRQKRINHIMHNQVYGIACTELTSLLARRSVYCSKTASGKHSVTKFETPEGNILFKPLSHTWEGGKCIYCGASQAVYDRGSQAEQYAYQFIHTDKPAKIFGNMKFDVIIGNPPYQLADGSGASSDAAMPIYNRFVEKALSLGPRYLTMIIPSKWMVGGRGLQKFRERMTRDNRMRYLYDYENASDCFPGVHIDGGVCYFLWDSTYDGQTTHVYASARGEKCEFSHNLINPYFDYVIRDPRIISILEKSGGGDTFSRIVSTTKPYGIRKYLFNEPHRYPSANLKDREYKGSVKIYGVKGIKGGARRIAGYIKKEVVVSSRHSIDMYKIFFTTSYSTNAVVPPEPICAGPGEVCTETFLMVGPFATKKIQQNCLSYISTNFFRFLLYYGKGTMQVTRAVFNLIPLQDFSHPWTDEMLYEKYKLTQEEIEFIESMIRPME